EVGEIPLREQVGADLDRLRVLGDDDAVLDRPEFLVPLPAFQVFAVKELDRFGLALARRHDRGLLFGLLLAGRRQRQRKEHRDAGRQQDCPPGSVSHESVLRGESWFYAWSGLSGTPVPACGTDFVSAAGARSSTP